ncbi:hypothetical protein FGRMN_5003 [Fusarium graminum]|nr:hypothetical protein FGRMN_5003 [Fusarium graminum]
MMSEVGNSTREQDFSTLEVNLRGEYSTLEVPPVEIKDPSNLVAVPEGRLPEPPQSENKDPWWRRYWIFIIVVSILITGGIIGAAVGATLASQKHSDEKDEIEESAIASSHEPTSTILSKELPVTSSESSTTAPTATTRTTTPWPSTIPTATPGPSDEPDYPIWVGNGDDDGRKFHFGFVLDGTRNASLFLGGLWR